MGENVDNISNFFLKLHSAKTDDEIINVLSKSREVLKVSPGIGQVFRLKEEVVGFKDIDDVFLDLENQRPKPRM